LAQANGNAGDIEPSTKRRSRTNARDAAIAGALDSPKADVTVMNAIDARVSVLIFTSPAT
jgi:hypothetical protein